MSLTAQRQGGATSLAMSQQNLSQDDGIVVGLVMSRVDERDRAVSYQVAEPVELIAMRVDFRRISPTEFVPAGGIVSEPFPKLGAWREFFHPAVDAGIDLLDPARPKPVNQHPRAIVGSWALIGALQFYALVDGFSAHPSVSFR